MAAADVHENLVSSVDDIAHFTYSYRQGGIVLNSPFISGGGALTLLSEMEHLGVALRVWAGMSWTVIAENRGYHSLSSNSSPTRSEETPSRQFVHRKYSAEVNRLLQHASRGSKLHELTTSSLAAIPDNRSYFEAVGRSRSGDRTARVDLLQRTERLTFSFGIRANRYEGLESMQRALEAYFWDRLGRVGMRRIDLDHQAFEWLSMRERTDKWWLSDADESYLD